MQIMEPSRERSYDRPMRTLLLVCFAIGCGGSSIGGIDALGHGDDAPSIDVGPQTVALTLVHRPNAPATFEFVVAYQDGSGPWTIAPAPIGDTYQLPIASPHYGYMWSCKTANARAVNLGYFTVAEHGAITDTIPPRCTDAITTVAITGVVANRPAAGRLVAQFGTATSPVEAGSGAFKIDTIPGTADLIISHTPVAAAGSTDSIVDQVAISRGLVANAAVTKPVDFATAAAVQSFAATIAATAMQRAIATTTLFASGGTSVGLVRDGTAPLEVEALAAAQVGTSDIYETTLTLASQGQAATTTLVTNLPGAETFSAPAGLGGAITTAASGRITTTWAAYPSATGYRWIATQPLTIAQCGTGAAAACTVNWNAQLSAGYVGTTTMFAMPDLSMLAGFTSDFAFVTGTAVTGDAQAVVTSGGIGDFPVQTPAPVGTTRTSVRSDWSVTPM